MILCYTGLSYNSVNLSGDTYTNVALTALIEVPSYVCCIFTFDRLGRKTTLLSSLLLIWVPCLVALLVPPSAGPWAVVTLATIAKFGSAIVYNAVFLIVRVLST